MAEFKWSPTESLIAYKGNGETLKVFNMNLMNEVATIPAEKTGQFNFLWSPSGEFIAIDDRNNQLGICRVKTGKYIGSKIVDDATSIEWSPDSTKIVVFSLSSQSIKILPLNLSPAAIAFEGGTEGNPWKDQKVLRNIDDCIAELKRVLSPQILEAIKKTKESELYQFTGGPSLAMTLRNTWGLNGYNPLVEYFHALGITGSRSMSDIVIECLWRDLNKQPIQFDETVASYKEDERYSSPIVSEMRTIPDELLQSEYAATTGDTVSLNKLKGKVKLLAFVQTKYAYSRFLLESLIELRKRHSLEALSIVILTFDPKDGNKVERGSTDDSKEIAKALETCKKTIPTVAEPLNELERFNKFVGGKRTPQLPQVLLIDNKMVATFRFNGWYFHLDGLKYLEKSITESLTSAAAK